MPTILTKKSDTPGSIPATANLTNAAGGAELAVNTADKRLFTITSGSQVVELGTNPSSITCADGSFTVARIGSGTVTQLTSTSATITTLTATSATVTNLTATSIVISNLSIASANITTLTSSSATISTTLALSGGTANGVLYLNGSKVATSGSALTFDGSGTFTVGSDAVATVFNAPGDVVQYVVDSNGTGSTASHQWKYGSTEAMRLNSTGLGLGTSSPAARLDVVTGTARWNISNDGSGNIVEQFLDSTGAAYRNLNSYALNHILYTSGSERMRLDSSGNVGIGTSSPTHKLQTNGSGRFGTMTTGPGLLSGSSDTFQVGLNQDNTNTTNTQVWAEYVNGATSASWAVRYRAANDTGTASTRLFLDAASGNLGIGTSSPAGILHLQKSAGGNVELRMTETVGATSYGASLDAWNGSGGNFRIRLNDSGGTLQERFRITAAGDVGIGTSSPAGKVHAVASTAGTTSLFERSTASTAVPVFASRSLATSSGDMADGFGPTHAFAIQDDAAVINPISEIGAVREGADNSGGLVFRTYSAGTATTQMRLDSSGNLGLGVTPSAANVKTFEVGVVGNTLTGIGGGDVALMSNAYYNAGFKYAGSNLASSYRQQDGVHKWNIAASGTAGNAISFTQAMTLDASGNLLVGGTSALTSASGRGNITINGTDAVLAFGNSNSSAGYVYAASANLEISAASTRYINFLTNSTERARITSDGNLAVGTTTVDEILRLNGSSNATARIRLQNQGTTLGWFGSYLGITALGNGNDLFVANATNNALIFGTNGSERARITSGGAWLVGTTNNGYSYTVVWNGTVGNVTSGNANRNFVSFQVSNENFNTAAAAVWVGKDGTSSRSINAGGTVNASGADYAEYMTKAGDFTIAKGDVCGINADGKLTNIFADAVSFVVKSTDPSYVGGDTWAAGLEGDEAGMEAARQRVDRIAFAGQVPVNVLGATPGQYIVPANDNGAIKGIAVSNPTFEQYQSAVGKVIAVQDDGRALIIVKVV